MNLKRLIFQDDILIKTDYKTFCNSLSYKTNFNFIKGRQDDKSTSTYYKSRRFGLPLTRLKIINNSKDNELKLKFKIADLILIIYGLSIISIWSDYAFDIDDLRQRDGLFTPILVSLFFYTFLQFIYYTELLDLMVDLKYIEVETKDTNGRFKITRCFDNLGKGYLLTGILLRGEINSGDKLQVDNNLLIDILDVEPTSTKTDFKNHLALTISYETDKVLKDLKIFQLYGRTVEILKKANQNNVG